MASLFPLITADIIGLVLIALDFIADVAFTVHLHKHNSFILFPISVTILVCSVLIVNFVAALGIQEFSDELSEPEWRNFNVTWLTKKTLKTKIILIVLALFGLLPYTLVGIHLWVLHQNSKHGNDATYERLRELLKKSGSAPAVKEIQSVLETGGMIYLKFFYLTLYALLYIDNWPVLLGLSINIVSLFFGLRKDLVTVHKFRGAAFIVAFVNLSLRTTIIVLLAVATAPWVFFLPPACSIALLLAWGAWIMAELPIYPEKLELFAREAQPQNIAENFVSSVMYSLFLVPCDAHTALSILPFTVSSLVIACLKDTPLALRILMPLAGTVGMLPPQFWWPILRPERANEEITAPETNICEINV